MLTPALVSQEAPRLAAVFSTSPKPTWSPVQVEGQKLVARSAGGDLEHVIRSPDRLALKCLLRYHGLATNLHREVPMVPQSIRSTRWDPRQRPSRIEPKPARAALILLVATLLTLPVSTAAASTQPPDLEIEVTPGSVEIPGEGDVEVLVVAQNTGGSELKEVRLSWFSDAAVDVAIEPPSSHVLVAYGALTWILRVSRAEGPVAGRLHLRIDYIWEGEAGANPSPRVAVGSLAVAPRRPEPLRRVAEIGLETALTSLNQHRPGTVYVVVSNTADLPIQIKEISPRGPNFVAFDNPDLKQGVTLTSGETRSFAHEVQAVGPVRPGKHLLLFDVVLEWEESGCIWTRRRVTTHEVEVGVFGETGILTAVGVPSFLILPGVLMLLTVKLLWRVDQSQGAFPVQVTSAEAGLIAVTLSLLTAVVYPVVTGWGGVGRNYLEGYELWDVMWVWFGSVVVAAVGYVLVFGTVRIWTRGASELAAWRKQRRTPSDEDPVAVLRKLERQGLGLRLPRVRVEIQGKVQRGHLLEPKDGEQETVWVGPKIVVKWLAGADPALQREVERQLSGEGSPGSLADVLERGRARRELKVVWKRSGRFDGPREVSAPDEETYLEPTVIVEQE